MVASFSELWFNLSMKKTDAINLLGGSRSSAAKALGVSYQAINKWPEYLSDRIEARVVAAIAKKRLPPETFVPQSSNSKEPANA